MAIWPFGNKQQQGNDSLSGLLETVDVKSYTKKDGFKQYDTPARRDAMAYVPFARCIDLISKQAADLVKDTLRVVDEDERLADSPRARSAVRLLKHSPDDVHTGREFIRDLMGDLLIEGNALVHVEYRRGKTYNTPKLLTRLDPSSATTMVGDVKQGLTTLTYQASPYGFKTEMMFPASQVVHAKFSPRDAKYEASSTRTFFSPSPLIMLAEAIHIGKTSDNWVGSFFDESARNNLVIKFPLDVAPGSKEEKRNIEAYKHHQMKKREALFLYGGAEVQSINPTAQDADALALREYGVQEIGRFYGVPAPLLGLHVTQWGAGIEHLARLYFRFSVRLHLEVLLDALSLRLLPEGMKFEVDPTQEVKGDMSAISTFVSAMRPSTNTPGVMSQQEIRDIIGARGEYVDDWNWESGQNTSGDVADDDTETDADEENGGQMDEDRVDFENEVEEERAQWRLI